MPELRKDPILGRWIIIAQERGKRPTDFLVEEYKVKGGFCPLCPGNEKTTPDEVRACERMFDGRVPLLGVVLNRAQDRAARRHTYGKA